MFVSPVSYWDRAHHGGTAGAVETGLALVLAGWSVVRFPQWPIRAAIITLAVAELSVSGLWRLLF